MPFASTVGLGVSTFIDTDFLDDRLGMCWNTAAWSVRASRLVLRARQIALAFGPENVAVTRRVGPSFQSHCGAPKNRWAWHVRMAWAVMAKGERYKEPAALAA
jgi:hypothetical protein